MPAPTFILPVTGTDPKRATKEALEATVNAVLTLLYNDLSSQISAEALGLNPKGDWSPAGGVFPSGALRGDFYVATTAGTVSGKVFAIGDWLAATKDAPSTTVYAANWTNLTPFPARIRVPFSTVGANSAGPYTLPIAPDNPSLVTAFIGAAAQNPSGSFTIAGATITFDEIIPNGQVIWGYVEQSSPLAVPGTIPSGTYAAPGLPFAGDTDSGLARISANIWGGAQGGVMGFELSAVGMEVANRIFGTAVTQSTTDTTANRLMKTGDGGFLGNPITNENFNTLSVTGLYRNATAGAVGAPTAAINWKVLHLDTGPALSEQIAVRDAGIAYRRINSGVPDAWMFLFDRRNILGTVSQTAGVPTGQVIERGSNANGEFVRFADGTLICTRTDLSAPNASTALGSLFRSASIGWTFPSTFIAAPTVTGMADDLDSFLSAAAPVTTGVSLRVLAAATKAAAINFRAQAIGRWF